MSISTQDFDWNHARAFLATAKLGSLSGAARALGQTQPTIGRQIARLEADLDTLLFDRVGQKLILTPSGRKLLRHVEAMNDAATQLDLSATSASESVEGHVTITMSDNMAHAFMPYVLMKARQIAPKITMDIHAQNAVEDLSRREADIALRHVRPTQGDLIAKQLRSMSAHLYGAKSYLDEVGRPQNLQELERLELLGFGRADKVIELSLDYGVQALPRHLRYASDSGILSWEMAKAGLGLIYMADDVASREPMMEAVLPEESAITFPLWLITHRELHTNRRIRTIFDLLDESFSDPKKLVETAQNAR